SLASMVVFWTVFYVWAGSELFLGWRLTRRGTTATARDAGSKWVLISAIWLGVALGIALALLATPIAFRAGRAMLFAVGIVVALLGMSLRWYSIWYLGRSFTCEVATRPDQEVVDTGPYRRVRHPSYAGGLLTVIGLLLCLTNPAAFAGFVVVLAGYAYRIRVEERVLARELGDPYRSYMRRTKRLIPFLV
ncbi:MAG TPA: isoprenylcysteine carboxylmethyltransferase family protein, partial [Candidatus Dormibacteraeota bacterium]|nr:isoprenylcysteine carboxylmethyltransferase family protein [Candidatus Dormibacteraeota bacterium]